MHICLRRWAWVSLAIRHKGMQMAKDASLLEHMLTDPIILTRYFSPDPIISRERNKGM